MADLFTDYLNFAKHSQADTLTAHRELRLFNDSKTALTSLYAQLRQMTIVDPGFEDIKKKIEKIHSLTEDPKITSLTEEILEDL